MLPIESSCNSEFDDECIKGDDNKLGALSLASFKIVRFSQLLCVNLIISFSKFVLIAFMFEPNIMRYQTT